MLDVINVSHSHFIIIENFDLFSTDILVSQIRNYDLVHRNQLFLKIENTDENTNINLFKVSWLDLYLQHWNSTFIFGILLSRCAIVVILTFSANRTCNFAQIFSLKALFNTPVSAFWNDTTFKKSWINYLIFTTEDVITRYMLFSLSLPSKLFLAINTFKAALGQQTACKWRYYLVSPISTQYHSSGKTWCHVKKLKS